MLSLYLSLSHTHKQTADELLIFFLIHVAGRVVTVRRREAGQREHEDRDLLPHKPRGAAVHGERAGGAGAGDRAVRGELLQRLWHAGLLLTSK